MSEQLSALGGQPMKWTLRLSRGTTVLVVATLCTSALTTLSSASTTVPSRAAMSLTSYLTSRGVSLSAHRVAHVSVTETVTPSTINTPAGGLATVSCPTTTFCVAVDNNGGALTYNGTSWSGPVTIDAGVSLDAVSCATVTFCVATDVVGDYLVDTAGVWSAAKPFIAARPGDDLALSVSCPTSTYCVALGMTPNTTPIKPDIMFFDNGKWFQQSYNLSDDVFSSVSCVSRAFCMGVTFGGYFSKITSPTVNGSLESANATGAVFVDVADGVSSLTSVSCAATTYCAVADGLGDLFIDSSNTWTPTLSELPVATNGFVSCSAISAGSVNGNNCIAIDDVGETAASSGTGWLGGDPGNSNFSVVGFSCANDAVCVGVDYHGSAISVTETLNSYSLVTAPLSSQVFDQPNNVTSLSCLGSAATHTCYAGDEAGSTYVLTASSWSTQGNLVSRPFGVVSLSCAGTVVTNQCWALDASGNPYLYNAGSWSSITPGSGPLVSPVGVSCSAVGQCLAVDQSFDVVRYVDLSTFSASVLPATDTAVASPTAVSCVAGSTRCVIVDSNGIAYISPGGSTWSATAPFLGDATLETPTGLSCATATFCGAIDDSGNAYFLNGTKWSKGASITSEPLVAISCFSQYRCVVSDDLGNLFIYDGSSWTEVAAVSAPGDYVQSLSCLSLLTCIVADSNTSYSVTLSAPSLTTTSIPAIVPANRTAGNLVVLVKVTGTSAPAGTVTISRAATSCEAKLAAGPSGAHWSSASCTLAAPHLLGTAHLSAIYHGSIRDASSQVTATATLLAEATTTTLTVNSTLKFGAEQKGHFAVVVKSKHAGFVVAGSVAIVSNGVKLCTVKLNKGVGSCSSSAKALAKGHHKVVANFLGAVQLSPSSSVLHSLTIN